MTAPIFWFRWLSLFSLDAVLVALSWQAILARVAKIQLRWQERALLGISIWIVYILDHLLDGIFSSKSKNFNQEPRHHFVHKHARFFIGSIVLALLVDISLLPQLSFSLLLAGSALGLVTLLYLFLNAAFLKHDSWFRGREIIISIIFTLGCGIVPLVDTKARLVLFFPILGLLLLATINCILIARLERGAALKSLTADLIPRAAWTLPCALLLLLLNHCGYHSLMTASFLWSLIGLSLIPSIAKRCGYEAASLATDGALILGALLGLVL